MSCSQHLLVTVEGRRRTWTRLCGLSLACGLALLATGAARAQDIDLDGYGDSIDNCVVTPNDQLDTDGDGHGDACECGDADENGVVDMVDVWTGWLHVYQGEPRPPLCDVTGDGLCNVPDLRRTFRHVSGFYTKEDLVCRARPQPDCDSLVQPGCADYGQVVEHVLGRIGYSGDAWTRQRVYDRQLYGYLVEQLFPDGIGDADWETVLEPYASGAFAIWGKSIPALESEFCNANAARCTDRISNIRHANASLAEVKLLRSIHSHRQLEKVLLDFWLNHFNVDATQKIAKWAEQDYEQDSIRPHVFGSFEELLLAVTKGVAMLDYLDLRLNRDGNINENYPRELLELGTVGKVGTYDEEDVQEVTRILTGWTYNADREFVYNPSRHEPGQKTVTLENTEPWVFDGALGCGGRQAGAFENEGHVLLCLLARHPKTAERLSRKLIGRLVTESPSDEFVQRIAQVWTVTGGDLREVTGAILFSDELLSTQYVQAKVKRPHVFSASLVRAVGAGAEGASLLVDQSHNTTRERNSLNGIMGDLELMGERLYGAAPPTGYPEVSVAWTGAGSLLARMNQAERIVAGVDQPAQRWGVPDTAGPAEIVERLESALAPGALSEETRSVLVELLTSGLPADLDHDERVRQAARVLLASPDFLLH